MHLNHGARCYRNVPADVVSHRRRGAGAVGAAVSASCAQGGGLWDTKGLSRPKRGFCHWFSATERLLSMAFTLSTLPCCARPFPGELPLVEQLFSHELRRRCGSRAPCLDLAHSSGLWRYCGWVFPLANTLQFYGLQQVSCLDTSPPGLGCEAADCSTLADCVQRCNRCQGCQAVDWMPLNPAGCKFYSLGPSLPAFLDYVSMEQLATLGSFTAGVYVNSRPFGGLSLHVTD